LFYQFVEDDSVAAFAALNDHGVCMVARHYLDLALNILINTSDLAVDVFVHDLKFIINVRLQITADGGNDVIDRLLDLFLNPFIDYVQQILHVFQSIKSITSRFHTLLHFIDQTMCRFHFVHSQFMT